jgi:HEAT repeat protein
LRAAFAICHSSFATSAAVNKLVSHRLLRFLVVLVPLLGLALLIASFQGQRSAGRSAAEWSRKLGYGTGAERQAAEVALRQLGERAVPSLRRALHASDPPFRNLLFRIANHSPKMVQSWIVEKFLSTDAATRRGLAARALGFIGPPAQDALPDLEEALRQGDPRVVMHAAAALGSFGPVGVPALIRGLGHTNASVRQAAAYGLSQARTNAAPAVPALRVALADTNALVRASAAQALNCIWLVPATGMVALVNQETGMAREAAAQALMYSRAPARLANPALLGMLASASSTERRQAVASLGYLQPWSQEVFAALVNATDDPSEIVRAAVTNAFGPNNRRAHSSFDTLTQALSNARPEVRAWSARTLGGFGPTAAAALPALAALAADTNAAVRAAAAEASALIQPPPGN